MSDELDKARAAFTRRDVLKRGGILASALALAPLACDRARDDTAATGGVESGPAPPPRTNVAASTETREPTPPDLGYEDDDQSWEEVRAEFVANPDKIHMAGLMLATNPRSVREAIARHREGLDASPTDYLLARRARTEDGLADNGVEQVMRAAGRYLDMSSDDVALTESTTMGLATVYNGLKIRPDQEILIGHWNHWATRGSIDYASQRIGFSKREVDLYSDLASVSADQLVDRLIDEIRPETRAVAVTWVHSVSGLKLPVGEIGRRITEINRGRSSSDRIIYCVDGVHGFGVEDVVFADLNCDFLVAGCHKWLFGPRGTGIIAGRREAWSHLIPTIPSFAGSFTPGRRFSPGGFKDYEHRWALEQAFEFHQRIGKSRVAARIHELTRHMMEGLSKMNHVRIRTPPRPELTAGIVTFEVDGHGKWDVLGHLEERSIVASGTPEDASIPRLAPGLLNNHEEVERTLAAIAELS